MKKTRKHRKLKNFLGISVLNCLYRNTKIVPNKVFFLNFSNRYECNPKYICEEFLKENKGYELVFATSRHQDINGMFPEGVKVVFKNTKEFYKELYSSKFIIDNDVTLAFLGFKKKKGQVVFQTFHGSIGIKAFGRGANNDTLWHKMADRSAKMTDYIISNSKFENGIYRGTFWLSTPILEYGHARNDILFKNPQEISAIKSKICGKYGINLKDKLCLYAPTFRDEELENSFAIDYEKLTKSLQKRFGGEWKTLVRFHSVTTSESKKCLPENVIDVSDYPDIQELAAVISCGITDYSSWICEYVLRRQPGFIFAPDAEVYKKNERPLTIPLEDLPFPLAKNMDELCERIENFDERHYRTYCDVFLKKHVSFDDGHASERVFKKIEEMQNS